MAVNKRLLGVLALIASGLVLAALLRTPSSDAASACSISWTGNAGNDLWSEAANWSPERLPDASDHVCTLSATVEVTQNQGSISTLEGDGTLSLLPGSELQLTDDAQQSSIADLNQSGGQLGGDGSLLITASLNWSGGEQNEDATTEVAAGATLTMKSADYLRSGRILQIDSGATATMSSTTRLTIGEEAHLANSGSFTIHASKESNEGITYEGRNGTFNNTSTGNFTLTGGGLYMVSPSFDNEGTVTVSSGTLQLTGGGTENGTFNSTGNESLVSFSGGTFTLAGGAIFNGHLTQTAGQIKGPLVVKNTFEWSGGEQTENATTEITTGATLTMKPGVDSLRYGRTLQIDSGATATMGSATRLTIGEEAQVINSGSFIVHASKESNEGIIAEGRNSTFNNTPTGNFTLTGGGLYPVAIPFDNEGTVTVSSGTLQLTGGGTENGTFNSTGNESLVSFGAGTFALASNTLNGHFAQTGGQIKGPLVVKNTFEWSGGEQTENATTEITAGATLTMKAADYLRSGRILQIDSGATATMSSTTRLTIGEEAQVINSGSFTIHASKESNEGITYEGRNGTFNNTSTGNFTLTGGGLYPVAIPFDNEGTVTVSSGTLELTGGGSENGTFNSTGNESLVDFAGYNLDSTFTLADGVVLNGHFAQSGGQIKGPLVVKNTFEWSGGEQTENATTEIATGATLTMKPGVDSLRYGRTLQIDSGGTATMNSATRLTIGEEAQVINSGSFIVHASKESNEGIIAEGRNSTFNNTPTGSFMLTGGGSFPIAASFDNEGTVTVSSGTLELTGGGSENGTFNSTGNESLVDFAGYNLDSTFTLADGVVLNGHFAQSGGQIKGPLVVKNTFEWSGGEQTENATTEIATGATLEIRYGTATLRKGRTLQIDSGATAIMTSRGRLAMAEDAQVENAGNFQADDDEEGYEGITGEVAGSTFRNTAPGTFTRDGNGSFPVSTTLINEGAIDVATGVLAVWNLTQTSQGTLGVHLRGSLLGAGFTQVDIEHSSSIAGKLRVVTEDGFHPEPSQHFKVLSATGLVGSFDALEEIGAIGGGWSYEIKYVEAGAELVVAGGPVPTTTSASLSGAGQSGTLLTLPDDSVVSAGASLSGADVSSADGSISYRVYSDAECHDEVANAGTFPVTAGAMPSSSQEAFPPGTYYWQASYSGDATNQRSATPCGADVETILPPPVVAKSSVAGSKEAQLLAPVSGHTANLIPVAGSVSVQLPGKHGFQSLSVARNVPVGTLVNTTAGFVTLCRAIAKDSSKQCAEFNGGEFRIQEKADASTAHVALEGGDFAGCSASRPGGATAASNKSKSQPARRLWGSGHGHFTTDGRNSSTTVRGTIWFVEDRCSYTLTKVMRGVVSVYDYRRHRSVSVSAGHSYVALAR